MKGPHRILYVRTDRIGDVLMNLPAIRALRSSYPKAWIAVLVDAPLAELLRSHSDIDEVIPVDAARLRRIPTYRWAVLRQLRRARFDLAIVSNPDKWSHALVWAAGIPVRCGWAQKWGFLLNRSIRNHGADGVHEIERNLELVSRVAPKGWDGRIDLPHDPYVEEAVVRRLNAEGPERVPWVVLHTGTSDPRKRWPAERWGELASGLRRERGLRTLLIGGSSEGAAADVVRRMQPDAVDWTGRTTLRELTALLRLERIAAVVSSDSGPAHIAWILKTPLVVLFPPECPGSDPARWGPLGTGPFRIVRRALQDTGADQVCFDVMAVERSRVLR